MRNKKFDHNFYYLECFNCQKKTDELENNTICRYCGGPLDVIYDYEYLKEQINAYIMQNTPPKVIKYLDFYPLIEKHNLNSLEEGGTPLQLCRKIGKKFGLKKLYVKNEGLNPTGAFKDRGSFVEINKAKQLGCKSVCVASTGNMAASVAAYSSQTGLTCYVFVPEDTPRGKLAQVISFGANIIQVRGTYSDAYRLALETAKYYNFYLAGDFAFRGEGQKSLAYEVCEQLRFGKIDYLLVPVGMGTNLSYIWKGFKEYYLFGLIDYLPKMIAVQAKGAAPIVEAFIHNNSQVVPIEKPQTLCSAVAVGNPIDAPKVLRALKESKGLAITIDDNSTLQAQQDLAKFEALYVEPSSAMTLAALKKLVDSKIITSSDVVVCIATGAGLKDPTTTLKVLAEPPTVEPSLSEVKKVIKSGILSIRTGGYKEKEKLLFLKTPNLSELKSTIEREFNLYLNNKMIKIIRRVIAKFIDIKGKKIAKADLQSIIETVVTDERRDKSLDVLDYHIETFKKKKPIAKTTVFIENKKYSSQSEGVGPVDAAIKAITKAVKKVDKISFKLTDFRVEIPTTGSDATVECIMVLKDKYGTQVVGKGTSPDIIVAAIEAYEKGYNELIFQRKRNGQSEKNN